MGFPKRRLISLVTASSLVSLVGCSGESNEVIDSRPNIVVSYSILGSVVRDLVGDAGSVTVLMPNGSDPHEWQPSAKDIETLNEADLVVVNGLGLEGGLRDILDQAEADGVEIFAATDYIDLRLVGAGEGADPADEDQAEGAEDPHLWTNPLAMVDVVEALGQVLGDLGIEVSEQVGVVSEDLETLDNEILESLKVLETDQRKLVTGHESLGYFAERYGFTLTGAIIPSLSSGAESTAADMTALKLKIQEQNVTVIFTELGTSSDVAKSLADDAGVNVVEISTHLLPQDGTYRTFMKELASTILTALRT